MTSALRKLPLWCVVQADGDKACTTPEGAVPVQYCRIGGSQPLIQRGVQRALSVTRRRQVIATVADAHRPRWSDPLWCIAPRRRVVDESTDRLTVTLAAALALVERATADALVVIQSTDVFCANERAFTAGLARALQALDGLPAHVVALTITPLASEPGHDYLLLGPEDGLPGRSAVRLVRRPELGVADRLVATGARLNTGVYVARLPTFISILEGVWPELMGAARSFVARASGEVLTPVRIPGSPFANPRPRAGAHAPLPRLRAVPVENCGWSSLASVAARGGVATDQWGWRNRRAGGSAARTIGI